MLPKYFFEARLCVLTIVGSVAKSPETAVQRLKRRISERLDIDRDRPRQYRKSQRGLAAAIGVSEQTLSELLSGPASSRGLLAHLDKIGAYFGVPPSLLVHRNDTALMEVQQEEYRLLTHWRAFPVDVQEQVMALFDYFAGLLPEEKEQRRWWTKIARIKSANDRARAERTIDEILRAQRTQRASDADPVARESFDATASAIRTRPHRRLR